MVFYYAYLPLLADAHPSVRKVKSEIERELYEIDLSSQQGPGHRLHSPKAIERDADGIEMHTIIENGRKTSIVTRTPSQLDLAREGATRRLYLQRETVSNLISTNSFSISYFGGVTALVLTAVFLFAMKSSSTYLMQVCVAFCGLWWYAQSVNRMRVMTEPKTILTRLAFMLSFTLPWLKTRPGPQLPPKEKSYFLYSWKKTFQTFRRAAKLRNTFFFLLSWALYADAYSTIAAVAVLFSKSALNMTK